MRSRREILTMAATALLGCSIIGCGGAGTNDGRIQVTCTTGMVGDLVQNIGGKHVQVTSLLGPGVDPHTYETRPSDARSIGSADVIFYSGLHLESKPLRHILDNMADKKKSSFAVTASIDSGSTLKVGDEVDPHLWHDVELWSQCADEVYQVLAKRYPKHEKDFKANLEAYKKKLSALHQEAKTEMASIPKDKRVLVTAHDAFSYFGKAYDVEVKAVQGITTEGSFSVKQINELVDFLTKRKIKAVFVEASVSSASMKALKQGCKSRDHTIEIGGELFSDSLGAKGDESTYEGMIRHNIHTIAKALK